MGKRLIDYYSEIIYRTALISFLYSNISTVNKQSQLILINEQLKDKFNKTLFQILYDIILNQKHFKSHCMLALENLLIEMVEVEDIESECDVKSVLAMDSASRDDILELLFFYWKFNRTIYEEYEAQYSLTNKFYDFMFMLKEENDENFPEAFALHLKEINEKTHTDDHSFETSGKAEVLLSLALKNGRKQAMKSIVELQTIDVSKIRVFTNESAPNYDENKNFLMKLLLGRGYNIHEKVNSEFYKENLDARITAVDEKYIKMNLNESFSGTTEEQNYIKIDYKSFCDVFGSDNSDKSLFSCTSILNTRGLRDNITHPVLSIIINLKALKDQRLHECYFWEFILFFIFPFYFLLSFPDNVNSWWFWCIYLWSFLLTCHEMISHINDLKNDLSTKNNADNSIILLINRLTQIDVINCLLSALILVLLVIPKGKFSRDTRLTHASVVFILVSAIKGFNLFPHPSLQIYMLMFKSVAETFVKCLKIFFIYILAFSFSFYIAYKPVSIDYEKDSVFQNFENFSTTVLKTIQMLSGEYTIEPFSLDTTFKKIHFIVFVIMSIIFLNFITGVAIDDIQDIRKKADILILQNQLENLIEKPYYVSQLYTWK